MGSGQQDVDGTYSGDPLYGYVLNVLYQGDPHPNIGDLPHKQSRRRLNCRSQVAHLSCWVGCEGPVRLRS